MNLYNDGRILHEDLAFISWLCGLPVTDKLITQLETLINANGRLKLQDNNVKYCVNLNSKRFLSNTLELGYCEKKTKEESVSDDVDDNQTTTKTTFEITNVGNLPPNLRKEEVNEGEITINIDGDDNFGTEDIRITPIGKKFYITYT
jgi:hypothetical protein